MASNSTVTALIPPLPQQFGNLTQWVFFLGAAAVLLLFVRKVLTQ